MLPLMVIGNSIGPEGAIAIAKALETNNTVLELNLVGTRLSSIPIVAWNLYHGIVDNRIGKDGAQALGKMLEKNTRLERLYLNGTIAHACPLFLLR